MTFTTIATFISLEIASGFLKEHGKEIYHKVKDLLTPTHEVIVLSRHDADRLREEAIRQKSSAKTLKEKMLAEMLEEMVSVIKADSQRKTFVFARKL